MTKIFSFKRCMAVALVFSTTAMSALPNASASLAPARATSQAEAAASRMTDMKNVQLFLEQKMVRQRLQDFGLKDDQIQARLNKLSDQQIHDVALHLNKQNPAADGGGFVVTVLLIGILALLFVYLLKRV